MRKYLSPNPRKNNKIIIIRELVKDLQLNESRLAHINISKDVLYGHLRNLSTEKFKFSVLDLGFNNYKITKKQVIKEYKVIRITPPQLKKNGWGFNIKRLKYERSQENRMD